MTGLFCRMDRDLGRRKSKDEPAAASVDRRPVQGVAQEVPRWLDSRGEEEDVGADDHRLFSAGPLQRWRSSVPRAQPPASALVSKLCGPRRSDETPRADSDSVVRLFVDGGSAGRSESTTKRLTIVWRIRGRWVLQLSGHRALCYPTDTKSGAMRACWRGIGGWWATLDSNQ